MKDIKAKWCKVCKIVKPAYFAGIRNDGKTKIYTDSDGKQWSGRICSVCQVIITRQNMQKLREKRKFND